MRIFGRGKSGSIEGDLERLYVEMLVSLGLPQATTRRDVRNAIRQCKEEGEREGTVRLPAQFGDWLLDPANATHLFAKRRLAIARAEGATDEDIREFWNLDDLQRRMVLWSENAIRYASFLEFREQGLSQAEAIGRVRKMFPMYGPDPSDESRQSGDDRPLTHEIRGRVDRYREKWGSATIERRVSSYSTYNAFVRDEMRKGRL